MNKKAFSEITSFILLFSLIALTSTIAYKFSDNLMSDKVCEIDLSNMKINFKILSEKISEIQNFDESTFSLGVNFRNGKLKLETNQMSYQSLIEYSGDEYCLNDICYEGVNGYEKISLNLSNSYTFEENYTISPGDYVFVLKNIKNESKIQVQIK